jgi:hypothetical protein
MRRTVVSLALTASILSAGPSSLFDQLRSFLSAFWGAPVSTKAGCGFDPWGRCVPGPQPTAGCEFDPNGRCAPGS